jgi:hypothetical protein
MFYALAAWVAQEAARDATFLYSAVAVAFDWTRLGLFSGSRIGEYGQSVSKVDECSRVPREPICGDWAGLPIAFISADFSFYTAGGILVPDEELALKHHLVIEVVILFRYDKSPRNFVTRRFRITDHPFLCPVKAAISIKSRALALRVPYNEPLGVVQEDRPRRLKAGHKWRYLRSTMIIDTMREACTRAYPDPKHEMRIKIKSIDAHSNRVTAAVALFNAGCSIPEIAHKLRWKVDSVEHYLRECSKYIGDQTQRVLVGAYLI